MNLLVGVCLLLASFTESLASPVSTTAPATTSLFAFDLSCTELSTFNNAITPLLNLTPPSTTPEIMVPHVDRRLSAIRSFASSYQNMINTLNMNNCAGSPETGLQARQTDPLGPFRQYMCQACENMKAGTSSQLVISLIDGMERAMGCSEATV
ncbi:hypothetical protein BDW66DRAFT_151537 [Aspergillus desertorum]